MQIQVPGHLGPAHKRPRGIPQGCPLSMMMLAYFTVGWAARVRQAGALPRALADDLMVMSEEQDEGPGFAEGVKATLGLLKDASCVVSVEKCVMLACDAGVRKRLRICEWGPAALSMKVTTDIRDLGAHLSLHASTRCGTAAERIARALRSIKRLDVLPLDAKKRMLVLKTKIWPMATYGCEATAWPRAQARQLSAQALNILLGAHSTLRAPELAWASLPGLESPDLTVLIKRARALRKRAETHPEFRGHMAEILDAYRHAGVKGTGPADSHDQPGPTAGPTALFLRSCQDAGVWLDSNAALCAPNEVPCSLFDAPEPAVRLALVTAYHRTGMRRLAARRPECQGLREVEVRMMHAAINAAGPRERQMMHKILAGAVWTAQRKMQAGVQGDDVCPHCGADVCTREHVWWGCPYFEDVRKDQAVVQLVRNAAIPLVLKRYGVPPALAAGWGGPFWDGADHHSHEADLTVGEAANQPRPLALEVARDTHGKGANARQLWAMITSPYPDPCQWPTPAEQPRAPLWPNVYTDGSVKGDATQGFTQGGAAAVAACGTTWHGDAAQWAHAVTHDRHDIRHAHVGGPQIASTRAEIAAVLLAIQMYGGIHVISDSMCVVKRMRRLRALHKRRALHSAPNGDLWRMLADALERRGWESVRVTWMRAHQTDIHADDPRYIWKCGNDIADIFAKRAASQPGNSQDELRTALVRRRTQYAHLVKRMHDVMLAVMCKSAGIDDRSADKAAVVQTSKVISPAACARPDGQGHQWGLALGGHQAAGASTRAAFLAASCQRAMEKGSGRPGHHMAGDAGLV